MSNAVFRALRIFAAGATALLPVLGGCGSDPSPGPMPGPVPTPEPPPARLVEVIATDYHFNPSRIYAEPGETLIISLRNEGSMQHNIELELGADGDHELESNVAPMESGRMTITVPREPGDYVYYCPVDNHRALGMEGTLTVAEAPAVRLMTVAQGLTSPLTMAVPDDGTHRRFIVDQAGLIRILDADGRLLETPFLDIRDRMVMLDPMYDERGLLGLAFHPQFSENGRFFVYYNAPLGAGAPAGYDNTARLSEMRVSPRDPDVADPSTERVLLAVDHPQSNHEGGMIAFGPDDGLLYISEGDGGGAGDIDPGHTPVLGNGQDTTKLLGKILRIDVDNGDPYSIPADNPFAAGGGAPEIYAWGFRNPYRFSFDSGGSHQLFVGDAGQNLWEEVSIVERGNNYGWNILEGTHCFDTQDFTMSLPTCARTGAGGEALMWPVIEIPNAAQEGGYATTVIGGHVYRGSAVPALAGQYVFGVWSMTEDMPDGALFMAEVGMPPTDLWSPRRIRVAGTAGGNVDRHVLAFAEDEQHELYVLTSDMSGPSGTTGKVMRFMAPE